MQGAIAKSVLAGLLGSLASAATSVGQFVNPGPPPAPWKMITLPGVRPTRYKVTVVAEKIALEAIVDRSMSLLSRPINIDLAKTPVVCWRWYVDGPISKADMTKRSGDDYAARLYVAFDIPDERLSRATKLKLRMARNLLGRNIPDAALVYVWDNKHAVGTARKSSYTDRSQLIVVETGARRAHTWVTERADLAGDFTKAFNGQPGTPTQLALAADGDNTKSTGRAAFADIHFVARDQACS